MATNMTFVDFVTPIPADWLNNVNAFVNQNGFSTNQVNFTYPATGAVATTSTGMFQDKINVKAFGAVGNGLHDDTSAIQAALNAANVAGGGMVYFPAGSFKVTSVLTLYPNVRVSGAGNATQILPTTAGMTVFQLVNASDTVANISFDNFRIYCGTVANIRGIYLVHCRDVFMHSLLFQGCNINYEIDRGQAMVFNNIIAEGTYVGNKVGTFILESTVDTDYIYDVKITNQIVRNLGNGTQALGMKVRRGVGVMLTNFNVNDMNTGNTSVGTGILFENDCQGCHMTEAIMGACAPQVLVRTGSGVNVAPSFLNFTGCDFDQNYSQAVLIDAANYINFVGGFFTTSGINPNGTGLQVQNGATHITVSGTQFNGWSSTGGTAMLFATVDQVLISGVTCSNTYQGVGATVSGGLTNCLVSGCNFSGTTNPIGGFYNAVSNKAFDNVGWAPQSLVTTPTILATGGTVTNTNSVPCQVFVSGGTMTSAVINGITLASDVCRRFDVQPGDTIILNYTAAPGWVWIASK